jgi:ParB family chromosome partitioning protein
MNPSPPPKSRLQLVRERTGRGEVRDDAIQRTRLVVSIEKLTEDPNNERKTLNNIEEMVASVKAHGIIEPITAIALADGRYQIVTGHRRYRAAKLAGLGQVEILIRGEDDHRTRRIKSLISNIQRENVPALELAEAIKALVEQEQLAQEQVARQLGKDKTWVSQILRILDLPAELKRKIETSQRLLSYDALGKIARIDERDLQDDLVEALLGGASAREIRERIKATKPGTGEKAKSARKPKRTFRTRHQATVTVQSETSQLTRDQLIAALQEALEEASKGCPLPSASGSLEGLDPQAGWSRPEAGGRRSY